MTTLKEKIAVMQAFADGAELEFRGISKDGAEWSRMATPSWNWDGYEYRVKREPREWWVNVYGDDCGLAAHPTREIADQMANDLRIDCVHVREVID